MNNNILNNKFFVVFLLFLIITFSFVSNCFAYTEISPLNDKYTFFMPDNISKQILSIKDKIPELGNNDYYYYISTSFFYKRTYLIFFPKANVNYLYGSIQHNDSIWSYTDTGFDKNILYTFTHSSSDLTSHTLELDLDNMKKTTSSIGLNSGTAVLCTYNPDDNYFWCTTNIPFYNDKEKSNLWVNSNSSFFRISPAVEIPALETAEQVPEAMATALKMIIPVSLVLLSILLLIYLMRSLIYRSL